MERLQIFLCGPEDVVTDMERVKNVVNRINGCSSHLTGITLDVDFWSIKETGIPAQSLINKELKQADLVIFLFHRRCGEMTCKEFNISLSQYKKTGTPEIKVWFEYVPDELAEDPGHQYAKLLDFKNNLHNISSDGFIYGTYKSDNKIAKSVRENEYFPSIENLCWQELFPFLIRTKGLFESVLSDVTKVPTPESITRDMILCHWKERAKRIGLGPIISNRYTKDENILQSASDQLISFILNRTKKYIRGKRVIELGSGIGRLTLPLLDITRSLTILDMSPDITSILQKRLGKRWNELIYIGSFVEDLPHFENPFDCAFSCLLFIHIVTKVNLKQAIQKLKREAHTVIICEHTDTSAQPQSSNFTRIWPRATYEHLFAPEFHVISESSYDYLGDKLELIVFQKIELIKKPILSQRLQGKTNTILKNAIPISSMSIPVKWKEWYQLFNCHKLDICYESLMGSEDPGTWEFTRDKLIIRSHPEDMYRLPKELHSRENELRDMAISEIEAKNDFKAMDESKARVQRILPRQANPIEAVPTLLEIHLAPMTYFQYLIMKKAIYGTSSQLREKYTANKHFSLESIGELVTTNIGGCGLFLLTKDGFIILSLRKMVAEHPDLISYSASGSMNWGYPGCDETKEANPFLTIMREGHEELGMFIDIDRITLYAIGIDITGMFIQFSFFEEVSLGAEEVLKSWKDASAKFEQTPFAVPFTPTEIARIVVNYGMEPSAAATLLQLSMKRFGRNIMVSNIIKEFDR